MSRSTHQRQQQKLQLQQQQQQQQLLVQQQMAENDAAAGAAEMFDLFCVATTMRQVLGLHRNMCDLVGLRPAPLNEFYPKLKAKVRSWKAQALWKKFDARAAHRAYAKGTACTGTRVLVIGSGPCGLRTAIEAQLLGAKVVVVEKRDRISRNNVLHLWPFVITDLRNLGAKKFYGKFCAGSIDHISIRQLQCILLKVALLLGVEVHEGVSFERTIEPSGDGCGWRALITPADHAVSHYEFDVLIGADGKRNTLEGFKRKEFRGKLAIAITANFINKKTEAEAKAEEISGVAFIFNQSFFKELYHTTGIDLENIVYYKDETHYFVMTAKKHSLIDKGVIMQDFADPAELLAPANVNTEKLLDYAREAAEFSTKYQMPNLEFAVNHYGKPDVAMFDFTSMFAAETSCRVIVRKGFRMLQCLVGDSLLEPFWPTGSGCARGFLSSMDAAYALKLWSNAANSTLGVLAQRESIYRLLNQTTPENLQRDIGSYTVDPATRYPNLNRTSVNAWQVKHLVDTDDKSILEQTFMDTNALQATQAETPVRRKRRSADTMPLSTVLLRWICAQLHSYEFTKNLKEVSDVFTNGKVLCALINRYRPDLVDFNAVKDLSPNECNELAFKTLDKELHIPRIMSGKDSLQLNTVESKVWLNYLEQICEVFRGEIPHVKHPKMEFPELREKYRFHHKHAQPDFSKLLQISTKQKAGKPLVEDTVDVSQVAPRRSVLDEDKVKRQRKYELLASGAAAAGGASGSGQQAQTDTPRRAKKRRSAEKATNIEERQKRLQEIEQNRLERMSKRRQQRYQQTQNFYKSLHMLQANTLLRETDESSAFEDYSIFLYRQQAPVFNDRVKELERKLLYPDRDRSDIASALPRSNADDQFSDRIKCMEQRITSRHHGTDKKPKDLLRAIGKIDSTDWNVREIEKKIEQSKRTEIHGPKGREKVPKWSKEQFMARQNKMAKPTRQDSGEEKFKEIDQTLKNLDKQLKEGSVLEIGERGRNKVASIAGQFVKKDDTSEEKNPPTVVPKSNSKVALAFKKQAASEKCHFCKQTVYLMEKIQTEGLILHRSCLKCHHCHTNLRLGGYAFDRDDPNGRFYCTQHFRLPAKPTRPVARKPGQRKPTQQQQAAAAAAGSAVDAASGTAGAPPATPDNKLRGHADSVAQLDLLDRGQTPERIEFENTDAMSDGEPSEEHIIDEHEWSGRNFLPESNNDSESELTSSNESDSEADMFEEANDSPLGVQTLQMATEWIGKQNYSDSDDSDDFYDSSEGIADDGKDDTEGEEFKKARELRREEVRLLPLPANLPTDTETELKTLSENKENIAAEQPFAQHEETKEILLSNSNQNLKQDIDRQSLKSFTSDKSFKSAASSAPSIPTTRTEMEKLDQNFDRKLSADIDAISEKLFHLNNMVKMNKDLETLAKENMVRSDILKKLSLKEKWLADNNVGNLNSLAPKSKFDMKPATTWQADSKEALTSQLSNENSDTADTVAATAETNLEAEMKLVNVQPSVEALVVKSPNLENKFTNLSRTSSLKKSASKLQSPNASPLVEKKQSSNVSRASSFKSTTSSSTKSANVSRASSMKQPRKYNSKEAISGESKMQIENILDIVKKMDISNFDAEPAQFGAAVDKSNILSESEKDMGKLLYDAENKFSPKADKRMTAKLKEIESMNFADTMDNIKAQLVMPTVSAQAAASVDLSKYFPNQKQDKSATGAINKNQKTLKDVDLTKYFPSSPVPQRHSSVVTVADKLKKSQTEKCLPAVAAKGSLPAVVNPSKVTPKRQNSLGSASASFSLRDHQLDGAADISKKRMAVGVATTTATASATKKGNVKIIKKIVPKGTKAKKSAEAASLATAAANTNTKSIVPCDESDRILDEILRDDEKEAHSPSSEYQKLFKEEKSPSEDISDKIERILEETGIDLGIPRQPLSDKRKKLLKAKSLGEGDFKRNPNNSSQADDSKAKECGDRPTGVQNILKRFESMSSVKSDEHAFKLRRMESTTGNLNKSRESIVSRDSIVSHDSVLSHESDSFSDLEKTMEYLKSEWRNEATNFLQKKRDNFFAQKRTAEEEAAATKKEELKKSRYEHLPIQYRESKLAKFFGIKQKSPEKQKSPAKKKSPVRKLSAPKSTVCKVGAEKPKSPVLLKKINNSMQQLADIANARQAEKKALKASDIIAKLERKNSIMNTVNERGTISRKSSLETPTVTMENLAKAELEEKNKITNSVKKIEEISTLTNSNSPKAELEEKNKITKSVNKMEEISSAMNADLPKDEAEGNNNITNTVNEIEDISKVTNTNLPKDESSKSITNSAHEKEQPSEKKSIETPVLTNANFELLQETPVISINIAKMPNTFNSDESPIQNTDTDMPQQTEIINAAEKNRPLVEDIRNLPKTGCDKSLNSSRRGSQASLQSRRCSDGSLTEKLQSAATELANCSSLSKSQEHIDELFESLVDEIDQQEETNEDECDSLNTSISKSPSVAPITVRMRGSSEDESIEKLFSKFSDEMLVNVEFDSNDELVGITPRATLIKSAEIEQTVEAERDYVGKLDSLERDEIIADKDEAIRRYGKTASESWHNNKESYAGDVCATRSLSGRSHTQFPTRPQRRQKSTSSSSEASAPVAPQRLKKKLAKLCPESMPPSVQDMLQEALSKSINSEQMQIAAIADPVPLKFPRIIDEDELFVDKIDSCVRKSESGNSFPNEDEADSKIHAIANSAQSLRKASLTSSKSDTQTKSSAELSPVATHRRPPVPTERKKDIAVKMSPLPSRQSSKTSLKSVDSSDQIAHIQLASNMPEWQPPEHTTETQSIENAATSTPKTTTPTKAQSKEKSLEWDMEKIASSPMPRRRFVHAERSGLPERNIRDVSAESSHKSLNSLNAAESEAEASQRRMIEEFEMERRKDLIQRDKMYQEIQKAELFNQKDKASNRSAPHPTAQKQLPGDSAKSTPSSLSSANRAGTPPMLKKLEIPAETKQTPESSRRSSYAFIELLEHNEPIIAPMPKKLVLPKLETTHVPDNVCNENSMEAFENRRWPNTLKYESDEMEQHNQSNSATVEPNSPVPHVFKNRQWPDGKTDFSKEASLEREDLSTFIASKRRDESRIPKPQSQSPQLERKHRSINNSSDDISKATSRSVSDLRKNTPPLNSSHNSTQSLHIAPRSAYSSVDTEPQSAYSTEQLPQRPTRSSRAAEPVDASTRLLLDRSKRLHNRKRDFVNERVAERNPYMRDVIDEEQLQRAAVEEEEVEEELESYRPRNYTRPRSRFPTSRSYGRSGLSQNYDYISAASPVSSYPDYRSSSRRSYSSALPAATATPSEALDYSYPSSTTASTSAYGAYGRAAHLMDYFKRSPSQQRERELAKESCVQSESESTSPDEVELNSATEISTDSEFDHDEIIRETPKIFIDDTHLRKPTRVQIKSTVITPSTGQKYNAQTKGSYLQKYQVNPPQPQFKPLVQVDPMLLMSTNRAPLQNPRPGDYLLNKTASTEGIASKKSLELKKRYLLGEPANGNKIQKSGSTSVLDSKIRSFQSNISECQKLLNPGSDISPSMKTFLDRTKLTEKANNDLMRSATTDILNDLKVQITIQKASSAVSTDNEKENVFVNSKNELNKGMEYSETVNTTLLESMGKKSPPTPTNNQQTIIETIDLVTPEKQAPIIDLTKVEIPTKMLESNVAFINNMTVEHEDSKSSVSPDNCTQFLTTDSNKIIDLTCDSPVKSDKTIIEDIKHPDVSKDVQERPDILKHIETAVKSERKTNAISPSVAAEEEQQRLLSNSGDEEKRDSPEKLEEQFEHDTVQIQVPNIPWKTRRVDRLSSTTGSSCSSQSSSVEDIPHYILESTTSPDTQTAGGLSGTHQVPRVEIHDTSGTLMQIDSLMIIDGKYIGDPEDLKYMEIPAGVILPELAALKTTELEDETELDVEPVTATPEPTERTVIEAEEQPPPLPEQGPPLPERGPPKMKPADLKFDTRNENKIESLKNLPLIVEQTVEQIRAVKPITLNLSSSRKSSGTPTTPTATTMRSPTSPLVDNDKTPTADLLSRGSDSETELTGTGQALTETELSDWTADDCISENFVDMEFVLNSNKGTIKRNKKGKKKLNSPKLASTSEIMRVVAKVAPVAEFEGIDIDDIEFMDTGSEGSCAEAYSATNSAMLRNRGYIEFVETTPKSTPSHKIATNAVNCARDTDAQKYKPAATKRDEKLGIDYIEQGAYIMQGDANLHDALKTPVNETPKAVADAADKTHTASIMTQSLTDSSTLNELDEDMTPNSQALISSTATSTKTTTEESDALTIVTSPLDTSSPKTQDAGQAAVAPNAETMTGSTPSSSEKNPKTSQSTCTPTSTSTASSSKAASPHQLSQELAETSASLSANESAPPRMPSEELSYEEYVRALQLKITQISSARDSLETRKQRRKSSKGEAPPAMIAATNVQTVIERTPSKVQLAADDAPPTLPTGTAPMHKVPEIPTLTRKLEEITKERTKQKDLIHDLVMDKLQSKKQMNAEKRLHRSRQRSMLTSGYTSGSSLSPTPKLAAAATTTDNNCTNKAHYHVSTAAPTADAERPTTQRYIVTAASSGYQQHNPLQKSATASYVSAYGLESMPPATRLPTASKQRPFSEHLHPEQLDALQRYKLSKTPSFSYALPSVAQRNLAGQQQTVGEASLASSAVYSFATPKTPQQHNRGPPSTTPAAGDKSVSASTENLRSEARARARLKSNSELGLSPEEKMQLLRKRLYAEQQSNGKSGSQCEDAAPAAAAATHTIEQQEREVRNRKISASKSVNDLAYTCSQQPNGTVTDEVSNMKANAAMAADFTSDPNLLLSSTSAQASIKTKSSRRPKEPERRKSLIQSLSSFFHKNSASSGHTNNNNNNNNNSNGKDKKEPTASAANSAQTERTGTSGSSTAIAASGSADSMFSRFRISPKSKEKSKDKDGYAQIASSAAATTTPTRTIRPHERSNSQDCLYKLHALSAGSLSSHLNSSHHRNHNNQHRYTNNSNNKHNKKSSACSSITAFSSSSPQLYVHKPYYTASTAAAASSDEQMPPPIPPLPLNYQRSDDESYATESREQKKQRALSKAVRQAELKRLRIAQEIQREQEEIEVQLKELEARGVLVEKALRGEGQNVDNLDASCNIGSSDEKLLKELLEIWRNITQLKKRDEELGIRQQELQLEHRHAQLKEELNLRLSCNKLDKSSADVAAEGAILNEMLEIVAKRAALRPTNGSTADLAATEATTSTAAPAVALTMSSATDGITLTATAAVVTTRAQSFDNDESHI